MKKLLSKSAKKSASSTALSFEFDFAGNGWGERGFRVFSTPTSVEGTAGYRVDRYGGGEEIWNAHLGEEESCCGFPVLMNFEEYKATETRSKEIGAELAKALEKNMVYLSAYVPETKDFTATRAILEAAGFKPGVALRSGHGKYHNVRWEWNADKHLYHKG